MSNFSDYIPPLIEPDKNPKKWLNLSKSMFILIRHSLLPHESPKEAKSKLTDANFATIPDDKLKTFNQLALSIYTESKESIKSIEEKAFRLLNYISALSAILFFFLSREITGIVTASIIISLLNLVMAMLLSLRCVGLKLQQTAFLKTAFNFDDGVQPNSEKHIISELMNIAVFNRNVANNTADILKSARYFLSFGFVFTFLSLTLFFTMENQTTKPNVFSVSLSDKAFVEKHLHSLEQINIQLEKMNKSFETAQTIQVEKINETDSLLIK